MMDAITGIATARSTTEHRVMNDYTYRQIGHIVEVYMKDKFLVVSEIAKTLGGKTSKSDKQEKSGGTSDARKIPSWFKRKRGRGGKPINYVPIDLDGSMESLSPFLGKEKISKKGLLKARRVNRPLDKVPRKPRRRRR